MNRKSKTRSHARQQRGPLWLIAGGLVVLALAGGLLWASRNTTDQTDRPISRLTTRDFHSLAFSLSEPETIYFGHHNGLLVSRDGGHAWQSTTLDNVDAMALALPPANPQVMYAAGHEVFFKSTDAGQTWQSVITNLPGLDIHGFVADPANAEIVFAHVVGFGLWRSEDGGVTWTQLSPMPPATFNLVIGETTQTVYATAGEAGLLHSVDGGGNWSRLSSLPGMGAIAVTFDPARRRLYATTLGDQAGLYISADGGASWTELSLKSTLLAVAISPHDPNRVIVVSDRGEVYASRDGGMSWGND